VRFETLVMLGDQPGLLVDRYQNVWLVRWRLELAHALFQTVEKGVRLA
jgi:hypothetical protein